MKRTSALEIPVLLPVNQYIEYSDKNEKFQTTYSDITKQHIYCHKLLRIIFKTLNEI